jgi:hypothetical protein
MFSLVMAISWSKHAGKWSLKTHTLVVHQGLHLCLNDPSQLTPFFTLRSVVFGSLLFVYFIFNYIDPIYYFFVVIPLLPTHCRCKELLLHLITHDTHTHRYTHVCMLSLSLSLSQWGCSGWVIILMQSPLPDNTQHSKKTDIHDACQSEIRTHNPSKWVAADKCLRPHAHQDRHLFFSWEYNFLFTPLSFISTLSGTQLRHKRRLSCTVMV